jgi:hypothetical protein
MKIALALIALLSAMALFDRAVQPRTQLPKGFTMLTDGKGNYAPVEPDGFVILEFRDAGVCPSRQEAVTEAWFYAGFQLKHSFPQIVDRNYNLHQCD